jgi:hypothetical protein
MDLLHYNFEEHYYSTVVSIEMMLLRSEGPLRKKVTRRFTCPASINQLSGCHSGWSATSSPFSDFSFSLGRQYNVIELDSLPPVSTAYQTIGTMEAVLLKFAIQHVPSSVLFLQACWPMGATLASMRLRICEFLSLLPTCFGPYVRYHKVR